MYTSSAWERDPALPNPGFFSGVTEQWGLHTGSMVPAAEWGHLQLSLIELGSNPQSFCPLRAQLRLLCSVSCCAEWGQSLPAALL